MVLTRQELLDHLSECAPPYEYLNKYPTLYDKYGQFSTGVSQHWIWYTEDNLSEYGRRQGYRPLTDATDVELLEMWALESDYWCRSYQRWYRELDRKIRGIE